MKIIIIYIALIIGLCSCGDSIVLSTKEENIRGVAIVIEKTFLPGTTVSGISIPMGTAAGTSGGCGSFGIVSGSSFNQYVLVLQSEWGDIFTLDYKDLWGNYSKGDTINVEYFVFMNKVKNLKTGRVSYHKHDLRGRIIINERKYYIGL